MNLDVCRKIKVNGLLCVEAASGYWGLSSYDYYNFPVFMTQGIHNKVEHITSNVSLLVITNPVTFEDTTDLGDGIYVTNKIRTVCDMIKYDCDEFYKIETVYNFYCFESVEDIKALEKKAKERGLFETLQKLRDKTSKR